jgi:hypothetical protein
MMMQQWTKTALLGLYAFTSFKGALAQTCEFDGEVFQRGDGLGNSFVTRCGAAENFPCFCNPDLDPPVECPYCGFAMEGGKLLCTKDGEIQSFVDIDGSNKTCGCAAPLGGAPTPDCDIFREGTCTIDLPDGTSKTFANGESLSGFLPNRCGSEYPCFCNPSAPGQIECPYCRFPTMGGDLTCAYDGDTVTFTDPDGVFQMCSCQIPNSPSAEPISNCNASPAQSPVSSPVEGPAEAPSRPLTPTDQTDVCTLELDSGQIITFTNGQSYGDFLTTRCGSTSDFPCFCNTALSNQVECPYCGFVDGDGSLFCAKDQETISFADGSVTRTCSCEIPDDPSDQPIRSCSTGGPPPTSSPVAPPTSNTTGCTIQTPSGDVVTVEDGESFGDLVVGVCGSAEDWPSFCNSKLGETISRQTENADYPYCIFENTSSGDPVCARNNEKITFDDEDGVELSCSCLYLNIALGGAQTTCVRTDKQPSSPTPSPDDAPTVAPEGASSSFAANSHWTMGIAWSVPMFFNVMF